jgi:hypothetical protein
LGLKLPSDGPPPVPEGTRIKTSIGLLTTKGLDQEDGVAEGSIALEVSRYQGRRIWQQVRHLTTPDGVQGDSILLERTTLRPIETWRWTPNGTYVARYHHRTITRTFQPIGGSPRSYSETLEVEPYSALGFELVVSAMTLGEGIKGLIPVAVDTAERGWSWLRYEVMREIDLVEQPHVPSKPTWVVDCTLDGERTRLWIAIDGRSVRRIEKLGPDNQVLATLRRVMITPPGRTGP